MKEDPKGEALEAIDQISKALKSATPLAGLERMKLAAVADYAYQQVGDIQELKRIRKPKSQDPVKP